MAVLVRDGGCMAPVLDPKGAGMCRDRWGDILQHRMELEAHYVRHGASMGRHESERDHVALCAGHHQGTGPTAGYIWATAHGELLRDYLNGLIES